MKGMFASIFALLLLAACAGAPPPPLSVGEIPAALQKEFKTAKEELRMVVEGIARQVERKQFGPAALQLQNMLEDRRLTKEQSALVARALISVNQSLNEQIEIQEAAVAAGPSATPRRIEAAPQLPAETQGDAEATAAARAMREAYRATK